MSDPRRDLDYLSDLFEAVQRILAYTDELKYEDFLVDHKTQDAVIRNLEVMGEATKNLSTDLQEHHRDLPWREMAAVRDRLIHHYFGVNNEIIWQIIEHDLPGLLPDLEKLIADLS